MAKKRKRKPRRKLRIALVSESFGYTSGVGVVLALLVRFFKVMGAEILLIGPDNTRVNDREWRGCKSLWLPSKLMKSRGYRRTALISSENNERIVKALRKVDIIFCESLSTLVIRVMILRAKGLVRGKVVFHAHTMADRYLWAWFGLLGWVLNQVIVRPATWFCLKTADLRIAPSEFFARHLINMQWCKKPVLAYAAPVEIPEGLPDPCDTEVGKDILEFRRGHDVVFIVNGRVGKEKRSGELIQLILRLRQIGVDAGLVFVGGGEIDYYRRRIAPIDRKHFLFTGVLDRLLGIAINGLCDVGIAVSVTDTQSLSFLEQMAMGLPMVALDKTVMAEYILACNCGLVLTRKTLGGRAEELAAFLGEKGHFKERGDRARLYVEGNFSEAVQFQRLGEIVDLALAA